MNMIRQLLIALTTVLAACAGEQKSALYGSWSSDASATKDYLTKHALLNEYQKKAFPMLFGRAVITFRPDGTGVMKLGAVRIPKKDGGELDMAATEIKFKFEILGETASQIVIKSISEEPLFADFPFSLIKVHDANTYSVMLSDGITEINGREFFKRVERQPSEQDGSSNGG
jgi:hypothetical protein